MNTSARMTCVVVLALLALAGTVPAGQAKGPTDVAVSGPGVDRALTFTPRPGDVDAGTLSETARIGHHWDGSGLAPTPPLTSAELGPRYVLTWTVADMDWAVQHAYPFAEGGAWVRFLPDEGPGGWVLAPALRKQLTALGAVAESPQPALAQSAPPVTASDASAEAPADEDDTWPSYGVAVPAGVLLAVAVVAGVIVVRRRLLSR